MMSRFTYQFSGIGLNIIVVGVTHLWGIGACVHDSVAMLTDLRYLSLVDWWLAVWVNQCDGTIGESTLENSFSLRVAQSTLELIRWVLGHITK